MADIDGYLAEAVCLLISVIRCVPVSLTTVSSLQTVPLFFSVRMVWLSACLRFCLPLSRPVRPESLPVYFSCQSFCLFVCLSVSQSLCLSVCQSVSHSVCLSVSQSLCLSVDLSHCSFIHQESILFWLSVCVHNCRPPICPVLIVFLSVWLSGCILVSVSLLPACCLSGAWKLFHWLRPTFYSRTRVKISQKTKNVAYLR